MDNLGTVWRQGHDRTKLGGDAALDAVHPQPESRLSAQERSRPQLRRLAGSRREHEQGFTGDGVLGLDR